jgi:NADPH:quinone reductase-like Zn-dependent oxidoreductase
VEAIGAEVSHFAPGDALYAYSAQGGGYAEYALVGEEEAAPKPASLSFEEAAAVPVAALTALQALRDKGELTPGERLLVNGGAGGVGHFAVQIGKALGARVVAVASGRNQEFLREIGGDRGIDYAQEDFTKDDETWHVIFDAVGKSSFRECDLILEEGGVYVTTSFSPEIVVRGLVSLVGGLFGPVRRARAVMVKPSSQDLAFLGQLIETGKLRPHVEEVFRLERIADAHSYSESGHVRGKLVIRIE